MKKVELLNNQTGNKETTQKNVSLIEQIRIENTPFTAIKEEGKKWMLTIGNLIIHQSNTDVLDELIEYIESKPWDLIVLACSAFMELTNNLKNK